MSFFVFILTLGFGAVNVFFALHYYTFIAKQLSAKNRGKSRSLGG